MKHSFLHHLLLALGIVAVVGPVAGADTSASPSQPQASQAQSAQQGDAVQGQQQSEPSTSAAAKSEGWDPWQEMRDIQHEVNRMFEAAYARMQSTFSESASEEPTSKTAVESQLRVKDEQDKYVVIVSIPGVEKNDVKVSLDGQLLRISAQAQSEAKLKGEHGKVIGEKTYASSFQNALTLPDPVNASGMQTKFQKGTLTVTIPKAKS
jgi:HSP20 family protein